MKISCPKCSFARDVDEKDIPVDAQIATCPKCGERFNFRAARTDDEVTPETAARRYEGMASLDQESAAKKTPGARTDLWDSIAAMGDKWEKKEEAKGTPGRPEEVGQPGTGAIPWEGARGAGFVRAFFLTVSRVILSGPRFFSALALRAPAGRAVLFYLLANFLPTFVTAVYLVGSQRAQIEPYLEKLGLSANAFFGSILIVSPLQSLVSLFLFCLLTNAVLHILGAGNVHFNKTLRIMAYAGAPAVFSFIPVIGPILSFLLGIVALAQGLRYGYAASWRQAVTALLPPYLLAVVLFASAARVLLPSLFS